MIKLKDIKVKGVCHANIFTYNDAKKGCTLEGMDMILYIDYDVDKEVSQLDNYQLDKYDLENLRETFASYISVFLEGDLYNRLNEITYENLDYRIISDVCSGVEEVEQDFSQEQQMIAFEMIKKYVTTDEFKKDLNFNLKR